MEIFAVVTIALVVLAALLLSHLFQRRRTAAMEAVAARLGLGFRAENDRELARRLEFLDKLDRGSNRYVSNCLDGEWQSERVMVFDYHYQTSSGRHTQHHHFSVAMLVLPRVFPELLVSPESFLSKIAQAAGYDDIDFESAEFSRAFCVRSRDKKFAYDVCHPRMMEFLLRDRGLVLEIDGNVLALVFEPRLDPREIESRLHQLLEIRRQLPEYLLAPKP